MTDSNQPQDQPHPHRDESAEGSIGDPGPGRQLQPSNGTSQVPQDWPEFETWLEMRERLLDLETREAQVGRLKAAADQAIAKALEAKHRADGEPQRQKMSLWERGTDLLLEVLKYGLAALLTLAIVALQVAGFLVTPWFFSLNLLIACLGIWARRFAKRGRQDGNAGGPEGDP